jgi:hypothetical protein
MQVDAAEAAVFSGQLAKVVEPGEQAGILPATNPPPTAAPTPPVPTGGTRTQKRVTAADISGHIPCHGLPGLGVAPVGRHPARMTTIRAPVPGGISEITGQIARSLIASAGRPGAIG